jgi:hypothetical protein
MNLLEYSEKQFLSDLKTIVYSTPSSYHLDENHRPYITLDTKFFGGMNWADYESNLSKIEPSNKKYFCLCLFTTIATDLNFYTNFKEHYSSFQAITNYPKFGWIGFGVNFEKPYVLIDIPNQLGVDFDKIADLEIEEYVKHHLTISKSFLGEIKMKEFFNVMLQDKDFQCGGIGQILIYQIARQLNRLND